LVFRAALKLGDVSGGYVQAASEDGLAEVRAFAHLADFLAGDRVRGTRGTAQVAERDIGVRGAAHDAGAVHAIRRFKNGRSQPASALLAQ
jgi:hypothetical protein